MGTSLCGKLRSFVAILKQYWMSLVVIFVAFDYVLPKTKLIFQVLFSVYCSQAGLKNSKLFRKSMIEFIEILVQKQ